MTNHNINVTPSKTLCWTCKNAVPVTENDEYIKGCSWSKFLRPVDGWYAIPTKKVVTSNESVKRHMESYTVIDCPEYEKDEE